MLVELNKVKTFYINLDKDMEKNSGIIKMLKTLDFNNYERMPGVLTEEYWRGLSNAHWNIFSKYEDQPFIIFEDDARPTPDYTRNIEIPDNADAVYLGSNNWGFQGIDKNPVKDSVIVQRVESYPNVYKLNNSLTTHAILYLNKNFILEAKDLMYQAFTNKKAQHCDMVLSQLHKKYNVYGVGPLFYQHDKNKPTTLIETLLLDYNNFIYGDPLPVVSP